MPTMPARRDWMLAGVGFFAIAVLIVVGLLITQGLDDDAGPDIHPTAPVETPPVSSPRPVIPGDE